MRYLSAVSTLVALSIGVAGCDAPARVASPPSDAPRLAQGGTGQDTKPVQMLDECDPATFDAAIGEGTCTSGHPGVTFSEFLGQLQSMHQAPAWRFASQNFTVAFGTAIVATNRGGEVHTFTRVAAFGGGVVPFLNDLAGTPVMAPECPAAVAGELVFPGGTDTDIADQHGTIYFECCIHPWMKTTVNVR